jgi:hypothetical protein
MARVIFHNPDRTGSAKESRGRRGLARDEDVRVNKREARSILDKRIAELRRESYASLEEAWLDQPDCEEVVGPSGVRYQVEIEAFWDDPKRSDNLRVLVAIDDGGWRAFAPLSSSFIIAPDGSFVGQ